MKEGWSSHLGSDFDKNCIIVDGLGAIWKIFIQTNQKRPEAKVDFGGQMTTLSKWYQIHFRVSNQFQGPSPINFLKKNFHFFFNYTVSGLWPQFWNIFSESLVKDGPISTGLVWMNIFQIAPKSSTNMQFPSKSDHSWLLQPSFIISPNSLFLASGLYLKHFFRIFDNFVNFGLWPLLIGLIEDFSKSTLTIHENFNSYQF